MLDRLPPTCWPAKGSYAPTVALIELSCYNFRPSSSMHVLIRPKSRYYRLQIPCISSRNEKPNATHLLHY